MTMGRLTITAPRTASDVRVGRAVWKWLREHRVQAELEYDGGHVRIAMPFDGHKSLGVGLDALTAWNIAALKERPLAPIYQAGVRYAREPMCRLNGKERLCEEWLTAHEVVERGQGDCDDLGPWLAAQRRLEGDAKAQAFAKPSPAGWHIVVRLGDGTIEDPSAKLGMPTA
jgi:hypothetical protein